MSDKWMPEKLWVIVRSTGEYSDRIETPIRYCLSEEDAQKAVALTSVEAQRDINKKPLYRSQPTDGFQMPDGSWLPEDSSLGSAPREAEFTRLPDAEEREAQNQKWREEYDAACLALGHVDPAGSWCGDEYYYEEVTPLPPAPKDASHD